MARIAGATMGLAGLASPALALDATWLANPTVTNSDGNFNYFAGANWSTTAAPTGTATFGASNGTSIDISVGIATFGGFTFTPAASNYTFFFTGGIWAFDGAGIVVNGGSATIINNTILTFENASTAGGAAITNNTVLNFGQSRGTDTASAGNAVIANKVVMDFYANTTAGSAAITNSGSLSFYDNSTAASATITNGTFSQTMFGHSGGTDTSSAGNAMITNNGEITFNANTTAGSATITNNGGTSVFGGFLFFGDTSTAGHAAITNNNGGTIFFNGSSTAGNATITNNSGGTTEFGVSPSLFGGSLFGGTDTSTAGNARITNNAGGQTLFFATTTAGNATITNNAGGTVAFFDCSDGGTATLINNGGVIDFSGSSGPLGNNQFGVGSLSGSGTFIVGPAERVNVSGNLAFSSGAVYLVQVSGASAGQIAVAGTTTLAGNVEVGVIGGAKANTSYDILHAATGLNGTTFAGVQSLAPGFAAALSYSPTDVFLNLTANLGGSGGLGANQQHVASNINNAFNSGGTLPSGFLNLFELSGTPLSNALTQVSGETAVGSQQATFNAMGQFIGVMTDPFAGRGGSNGSSSAIGYAATSNPTDAFAMFTKAPPAPFAQRWSVWASAFGGAQTTDSNAAAGTAYTSSNIVGTAVGADYLLSPDTLLGFAMAGGGTSFAVANGGTGRSDLFQMGAYVRHTLGPAYVSAALAYGWQDITTYRTVTVAGFDQLRAEFNANAWSGRLEGGYRFVAPAPLGVGITPYAAAQFVTFDLPAYAEQVIAGTNAFALAYGAKDVTDARTELGIRTDKSFLVPEGILTLRGRLGWAHDYDPNRAIAATFQSLPGAGFVVNGAAQAADSALTTASVEMKWRSGWSAAATFEGEFSNLTQSYAGKGVARYQW
jgi:uncharacterized protein with beta-barrel porin domain